MSGKIDHEKRNRRDLKPAVEDAETARMRAIRRAQWVDKMREPATERQLAYLEALGYEGPPPATKSEASYEIDLQRRRGRPQ